MARNKSLLQNFIFENSSYGFSSLLDGFCQEITFFAYLRGWMA